MDSLCNSNAIDTLLSNFILPLQGDEIITIRDSKVGCASTPPGPAGGLQIDDLRKHLAELCSFPRI